MLYEGGQRSPKADYLTVIAEQGVDVQYVLNGNRSVPESQPLGIALRELGPDLSPVKMYDIEASAGAGRSFEGEPVKTTLYFSTVELAEQGLDGVFYYR